MSEPTLNQPPTNDTSDTPGAWQDIVTRLKRKERETILAVAACGIAVLQSLIGATGGTFLTAAMGLNLALIGWLANTAFARKRAHEGTGLLVLTGVAFVLAALSTLYLAEGLTEVLRGAQALEEMGQAFGDIGDLDF